MADFPAIKPTSRRFTLGDYPTKTYRALSGKITKRNFGNKAFGHTIELSFDNVKTSVVRSIISHYNTQRGQTIGFRVRDEIFAGLDSATIAVLEAPSETLWFYAEPPSIESVYQDLSTVTVRLVAEIT